MFTPPLMIMYAADKVEAPRLAAWVLTVLLPILVIVHQLLTTVFLAFTAVKLHEASPEALP